jgi:hypothetical protein
MTLARTRKLYEWDGALGVSNSASRDWGDSEMVGSFGFELMLCSSVSPLDVHRKAYGIPSAGPHTIFLSEDKFLFMHRVSGALLGSLDLYAGPHPSKLSSPLS